LSTLSFTYEIDESILTEEFFLYQKAFFRNIEMCFQNQYYKIAQDFNFNAQRVHFRIVPPALSGMVAAFDSVRSNDDSIFFIISSAVMLQHNELTNPDNSNINLGKVLMHELVHALDSKIIKENYSEYDLAKKLFMNEVSYNQGRDSILETDEHFSVQWTFLNYLANMRNEGVAILGQKILHDEHKISVMEEGMALLRFRKDLDIIVNMCLGHAYHQRLSGNEAKAMINAASSGIYEYSDAVLLAIMKQKNIGAWKKLVETNVNKDFFLQMIHMDLSEWINAMLLLKDPITSSYLIDRNSLFKYCNLLGRQGELANAERLIHLAYNRERQHFIDNISHVIESEPQPWTFQGKIDQLFLRDCHSDLFSDVRTLSLNLLQKRTMDNSIIVDMALTYLFHEEDIIHDDISFIGLQDDWFVLDGASVLIFDQKKGRGV
jgi:hypothetical protein